MYLYVICMKFACNLYVICMKPSFLYFHLCLRGTVIDLVWKGKVTFYWATPTKFWKPGFFFVSIQTKCFCKTFYRPLFSQILIFLSSKSSFQTISKFVSKAHLQVISICLKHLGFCLNYPINANLWCFPPTCVSYNCNLFLNTDQDL